MKHLTKPPEEQTVQQKKLLEYRRKKLDLQSAIRVMWRTSTDAKGKLDKIALITAVTLRIKEEKIPYEYELAKSMVDLEDRRTRPPETKDAQGTFTFYNAESYIPIGDNERRSMPKATKEDIAAWQEIEQSEFEASRVAYQRHTDWRIMLLTTWRYDEKALADVVKRLAAETTKTEVA